jgi:hypothetical protein
VTTYRTGNNWGVTIVAEGNPDPNPQCRGEYHGADGGACGVCGWDSHAIARHDDQLVAVVVNGDQALAERICELLNSGENGGPRSVVGDEIVTRGPYTPPEDPYTYDFTAAELNSLRDELIALRKIATGAAS